MKRVLPVITVGITISLLLVIFIVLSTDTAAAGTLCDRHAFLSRIFPDCAPTTPPPPPADTCPNVPGNQTSGPCADDQCRDQGGTWNGEACELPPPPPPSPDSGRDTRNSCERYLSSRTPPPQSCDVCPNVVGVQLTEPCADKMCVDDGGTWTDNACIVPPPDLCPNASGIQTEEPCPDQICVDNGGIWNGDACELPPPPENTLALCADGIDNDEDSAVDLEDSDCESYKPKIVVIKIVINDNGGTAVPSDFSLYVRSESSGQINVVSGATATLPHAGLWIVGEFTQAGYEPKGFGGDCANGAPVIAVGELKTCTITNDDIPSGGGGAGGGGGGAGGGGAPSGGLKGPSGGGAGGGGGGGGSGQ